MAVFFKLQHSRNVLSAVITLVFRCTDHMFNSRDDLSEDDLAFRVGQFPLCGNLGVELSTPSVLHHQV